MLQESDYRKELYQFFEKELLKHDDKHKMQKQACLAIEGIRKGQSVANNNNKSNGEYTYQEVYYTALYSKKSILDAFHYKKFTDETGMVRYACAIIRNKINTISKNLKEKEMADHKIQNLNTDNLDHESAKYVRKTVTTGSELDDLW